MIVDNDICFQAKLCVFILFSLNVVSSNIVNKCENKFIQSKLFCIFFSSIKLLLYLSSIKISL